MVNKLRADNCTAVTALLDPPGPPLSGLLAMHKQGEQVESEPEPTRVAASDDADCMDSDVACSAVTSSDETFSELAALLSAPPVVSAESEAKLLETSLQPLAGSHQGSPPKKDPIFRVLRNRTLSASSLDNKCAKKASPSLLSGIRKKVVTVEGALLQLRKRPVRRSFHDMTCDERNASDTENQVKKSRQSLPAAASQRILRSGTVTSLVRTLRSQDSNLRIQGGHSKRKRSRSFTPMKRRK